MKPLLTLFIEIALLRAKPQDVPASRALMLLAMLLGLASGVPAVHKSVGGVAPALMIGLLDVALILVLLRIFLTITGHSGRLIQAATALFGTGIIINLLAIPVQLLLDTSTEYSATQFLGALFYFLLLVWGLLIMGHILRHTFSLQLSSGILISIGYFMLINTIVRAVLGSA